MRVSMVAVILILLLSVLVIHVSETFGAYEVGLTHGTNKLRPEFSFEPLNVYDIHSAKNEWEPFQILIRDDVDIDNVDVTVSEFTGPGNPITEIDIYRVHYQYVYSHELSHHPVDPNKAGYWPDGLVPFVDHFDYEIRDGAPFDVPPDFSQAVFVDVYVPDMQTPGVYNAIVTVTANGRADWTGTITLTVWDFELPNSVSLVSNYSYSRGDICNYHTIHGNVSDCEPLHWRYFEEYARHRMAAHRWSKGRPPYTWDPVNQTLTYDWAEWDVYHTPVLDGTFYRPGYEFRTVNFSRSYSDAPSGVTQDEWNRLNWEQWALHFKDRGWIEKLWCYLPDEPSPDQYDDLADLAAKIHAADPDLQPFVTEQYDERLGPDIDIWCPDEPLFSDSMPFPPYPEKYEELRQQGKKTWWYNCVSATLGFDYSNHMVDMESSYMRIWLWLTRRYGFTGILFWRVSYLWDKQDVWESMYSSRFLCQGDGTLFYPGTPDKIGGTTDIPIPSLRLKYLREGMEDYEYFMMLDQGGEREWMDDMARIVAPKTYIWEHDWEQLLKRRKIVAEKIMGTLDEEEPDPPGNLQAEAQVSAVELTWSPPSDQDLAGYDIYYAIYEGDDFFGGSMGPQATGAVVTGLTSNVEHTFWLNTFDENGNRSEDSSRISATPLGESEDYSAGHNPNGVKVEGSSEDDSQDVDDPDDIFGCGGW